MNPLQALIALSLGAIVGSANAQTVLIDATTRNGSFEDLPEGVTDVVTMDDETNDVPAWQDAAGPYTDSGVTGVDRDAGTVYDGMFAGKAQNGAYAYNQTDYVIQEGDLITLTWQVTSFFGSDGAPSIDHYVSLFGTTTDYEGRATLVEALDVDIVNGVYSPGEISYTATADDAGLTLGISFGNRDGFGWIGYDFFELSVIESTDEDADGLIDSWEISNFGDLTSARGTEAQDVSLGDEWDNDGDGVDNATEYAEGSDPTNADSVPGDVDGDGLLDEDEILYFGNLNQNADDDFDRDYNTNGDEIAVGTFPDDASDWPDSDSDGMNDGWEAFHSLDVGTDDSADDPDGDGADNLAEHDFGSDPNDSDWSPTNALLQHRWSFNGTLEDSVGGSDAFIVDPDADPAVGGGAALDANNQTITMDGGAKGTSEYVDLGSYLLSTLQDPQPVPVTVELWATQNEINNWSRIIAFGTDDGDAASIDQALFMTWTQGTDIENDRVGWAGRSETNDGSNSPYLLEVPYHMVMTIVPAVFTDGFLQSGCEVTWYASPATGTLPSGHPLGDFKGSFLTPTGDLGNLLDSVAVLGRSMWPGDATASATYDEVRIWLGSLSETERELFHLIGPDSLDREDSDSDGFPDAWEMARFGDLDTATMGADADGDGFDDDEEFLAESDPNDGTLTPEDLDGDPLFDLDEILYFNNLLRDGTGDYDGDFSTDAEEIENFTDPTNPDDTPDLDEDGLPDGWERTFFGSTDPKGTDDPDGDGDDNLTEYLAATDPTDEFSGSDTDLDGLADFWEITYFGDFTTYDGTADPDTDGFTNLQEYDARSVPTDTASIPGDINGDGVLDVLVDFPEIAVEDTFDSYEDNTFILYADGADTVSLVDDGDGGNAVQYTNTTPGGFMAAGFDWVPEIQPGASGPNTSNDLVDYVIYFELTFDSEYVPPTMEIWLRNNAEAALAETARSANLYAVASPATGITTQVVVSLANAPNVAPFGWTAGAFTPTMDDWQIRLNALDGGSPDATEYSFKVDNFRILTVESIPVEGGYADWAMANGLMAGVNDGAEDNPDGDSQANVLEYQLNGDPLAFDGDLVDVTHDETYLVFQFERFDNSEEDTTLSFGWSTDLAMWNSVTIGATGATDSDGIIVNVSEDGGTSAEYDMIEVQVPRSLAVDGKLFGRLEGTQP